MKRFTDKYTIAENGCWLWINCGNKNVYGTFKINGKTVNSHRFSYMINKGIIPNGMYVCHTCDDRRCVNPDHLFIGTPKENHDDGVAKGRISRVKNHQPRTHPSTGAYNRGCRCLDCKSLHNLAMRKHRLKLKEK